ncbi:hypothetical protein [uncultured Tenacibaculum sp.]|uniref:hypothetical protein n=1 Tax=uncultured Tenacibaculum sp. TaxID=174713 RepID=UPI002635CC2D|nr:hypothetical protein [uncultured Tenacibaculum sp.]
MNFSESIRFGTSLKKVKSKLKKPFRIVKQLKYISILFTELKILDYKFIVEMHFYKQELVCFKYIFRDNINKEELKNIIVKKYLKENFSSFNFNDCHINDEDNNCLFLIDEVNLSVNYIGRKKEFYNYVIQLNEQRKAEELLKDKERSTTSKLYKRL